MPDTDTRFDLAIIGLGAAGLNALAAAQPYLRAGQRVALIDRRDAPGGMWNDTYSFCRLHQPREVFTVGDIPWTSRRRRGYFPRSDETRDHMHWCLAVLLDRMIDRDVRCSLLTGCDVSDVRPQAPGAPVQIRLGDGGRLLADRVIDARVGSLRRPEPLRVSSKQVVSTVPENLVGSGDLHSDGPLVVVGGGKTGADVVLAALRARPHRRVYWYTGRGAAFLDRDRLLPSGTARWFGGTTTLSMFRDISRRFDGTNAAEVFAHARDRYMLDAAPAGCRRSETCQFGLMSRDEIKTLERVVYIPRYFEDAVDDPARAGVVSLLARHPHHPGPRDLRRFAVPERLVVVNCTGHVLRERTPPARAVSADGRVLTITARDTIHVLSAAGAYLLTHAWMLGRLDRAGFYTLDAEALFATDRCAWTVASAAQSVANTVGALGALPASALQAFGSDMDTWHVAPRRAAGLIGLALRGRAEQRHAIAALDEIRRAHGIEGGLLRGAGWAENLATAAK